jgi:hypothetical protein
VRKPLTLLVPLGLLVLGLIAGLLYWPRWQAPADSGEERLRQRAESYYRAQRLVDYRSLAQHFTPARQLGERAELEKQSANTDGAFSRFDETTQSDLKRSAETIIGEELSIEVDGDWALTSGSGIIFTEGAESPIPLAETVWVRSGGEWWVYMLRQSEMNYYGNPPERWRRLLERQQKIGSPDPFAGQQQSIPGGGNG